MPSQKKTGIIQGKRAGNGPHRKKNFFFQFNFANLHNTFMLCLFFTGSKTNLPLHIIKKPFKNVLLLKTPLHAFFKASTGKNIIYFVAG